MDRKTFWVDTELRIVHTENGCPDAKMAVKYRYLKTASADNTLPPADILRELAGVLRLDEVKRCVRCVKKARAAQQWQGRRRYGAARGARP